MHSNTQFSVFLEGLPLFEVVDADWIVKIFFHRR